MRYFPVGIERMRWIVWRNWFTSTAKLTKKTQFLPNIFYDCERIASYYEVFANERRTVGIVRIRLRDVSLL